jgi:tRNA dimethylallyltransferase
MKNKIIVIAGPTGAGKTSTAINIAKSLGGEIISADSVQVYKYLNIGSAKPTSAERSQIPHHLIDIVEPDIQFSGGMFQTQAQKTVVEIESRNKAVIVCGGTGLYIRSLIKGLFPGPTADKELRNSLELLEKTTPGSLHEKLSQIDPDSAKRLHPRDKLRLIRAIEVFELTGITITQHHLRHKAMPPFRETLTYIINPPKEILEERIKRRVMEMLDEGFIKEVSDLLARGYSPTLNSMQSVGYRQVVNHLQNKTSSTLLYEQIVQSHIKYVKQQRTWFAKEGIHIESGEKLPLDQVKSFLET